MRKLLLILLLLVAGCSGLRLPYSPAPDRSDWPMFGADPSRGSTAPDALTPPLTLAWKADLTGGIGQGSPVIVDSTLFIGNLRGELYGINVRSGQRRGWLSLGEAIEGSPAVGGSVVVVALTNTPLSLVAFDLIEGKILWRRNCGDIESSLLMMNDRVFAANTAGILSAFDVRSGEPAWTYAIPDNERLKGFRSSPAAAGDSLVVLGGDDGLLRALGAATGNVRWTVRLTAAIQSAPVISGGVCVAGDLEGNVVAVDAATGRTLWTAHIDPGIVGHAVPTRDAFVFGTSAGKLHALARVDGHPVWTTDAGGPLVSGGVLAGSLLYFGTLTRELLAVQPHDGTVVWRTKLSGRIKSSPAASRGRLFVATDDRLVNAFQGSD
jgi:outer membrane protein assembly factor BamB